MGFLKDGCWDWNESDYGLPEIICASASLGPISFPSGTSHLKKYIGYGSRSSLLNFCETCLLETKKKKKKKKHSMRVKS